MLSPSLAIGLSHFLFTSIWLCRFTFKLHGTIHFFYSTRCRFSIICSLPSTLFYTVLLRCGSNVFSRFWLCKLLLFVVVVVVSIHWKVVCCSIVFFSISLFDTTVSHEHRKRIKIKSTSSFFFVCHFVKIKITEVVFYFSFQFWRFVCLFVLAKSISFIYFVYFNYICIEDISRECTPSHGFKCVFLLLAFSSIETVWIIHTRSEMFIWTKREQNEHSFVRIYSFEINKFHFCVCMMMSNFLRRKKCEMSLSLADDVGTVWPWHYHKIVRTVQMFVYVRPRSNKWMSSWTLYIHLWCSYYLLISTQKQINKQFLFISLKHLNCVHCLKID